MIHNPVANFAQQSLDKFLFSNLKSVAKIELKKYPIQLFEVLVPKLKSLDKFERKKSVMNQICFQLKSCGKLP